MAENGLGKTLNRAAAIALFCLSSATALSQINQHPKPAEKLKFLSETRFKIPLKSFHSDRLIKFNEWNPGLLIQQRISPHMSVLGGGYYNSNYHISPLLAAIVEPKSADPMKVGLRANAGIIVGFAGYKKRVPDIVTTSTYQIPSDGKIPGNERKRGQTITRYLVDKIDSTCGCKNQYVEIVRVHDAHGTGKRKAKFVLAALFSMDYNGIGGFVQAAGSPSLGSRSDAGQDRWGYVVAGGLDIDPYRFANRNRLNP